MTKEFWVLRNKNFFFTGGLLSAAENLLLFTLKSYITNSME
jgi:hypothetical protein